MRERERDSQVVQAFWIPKEKKNELNSRRRIEKQRVVGQVLSCNNYLAC